MNFLAHLFLSGSPNELMIGNFIADFIRGKQIEDYPQGVKDGIYLHRQIDYFTDHHLIVKKSTLRLSERFGRYASVIVDVFYDHFLATNWQKYHPNPLEIFAEDVYQYLSEYTAQLPEKVKEIIPKMATQNWLVKYGELYGIERSLIGIANRAKYNPQMEEAIHYLEEDYHFFEEDFTEFFPELQHFVKDEISKISVIN
jgi:acyl carrier protein phosphodiesterase